MKPLNTFLNRLSSARSEQQQKIEATRERLINLIVDEVLGAKRKASEADATTFLETCVGLGLVTEDEIKDLFNQAATLKGYLEEGEAKPFDIEKLQADHAELIQRTREKVLNSARQLNAAQEANGHREASRTNAQILIKSYPELAIMAAKIRATWSPKVPQFIEPELPTDGEREIGQAELLNSMNSIG